MGSACRPYAQYTPDHRANGAVGPTESEALWGIAQELGLRSDEANFARATMSRSRRPDAATPSQEMSPSSISTRGCLGRDQAPPARRQCSTPAPVVEPAERVGRPPRVGNAEMWPNADARRSGGPTIRHSLTGWCVGAMSARSTPRAGTCHECSRRATTRRFSTPLISRLSGWSPATRSNCTRRQAYCAPLQPQTRRCVEVWCRSRMPTRVPARIGLRGRRINANFSCDRTTT